MNKKQKLVQQQFLNNEEAVIHRLEQVYYHSQKQVGKELASLQKQIDAIDTQYNTLESLLSDEEKEILLSKKRSKVYQKKYQEGLKKQLDTILDDMLDKEYKTVSEYLEKCYEDGFIGTMYDLQGQGIPLCMPLDQESMVRAVQLDSKISKGLYEHLGENVTILKRGIAAEISRGIATSMTYSQIAQQLSQRMVGTYENPGGSLAYAMRIARTEGHRIQCQAGMDACEKAKAMGCDVVKQWDATLDQRTRERHREVDGQIRELDDKFSNGLMFPGDPAGGAAEVVNCRCALLQRAKWALDDDELETLKERAKFFGLDKTQDFEDFKANYLSATKMPAAKPKKEYLTQKKLEEKIKDNDAKMAALKAKYNGKDIGSWSTEDQLEWMNLEFDKNEWQEKLDKKVASAATKKLKKECILLQDELDAYPVKTYSGIWKDDVTTADWSAKKDAIPAKKKYFKDKWMQTTDPDEEAKWQALLDLCDEFDKDGAAYNAIQQKLIKANADLKKLQKNGKISAKDLDAFTQARKDAALWFDRKAGGFRAADAYFDPPTKSIFKNSSKMEFDGFYTYTSGSGGHNRPLAGFRKPWSKPGTGWEEQFYVGSKKVWIDFEGKGDQIRGLTTLIEKSVYDQDVWLQSGQGFATLEGFLGIKYGTLQNMTDAEMQQFVGRRNVFQQFLSTAVNEGGGSIFNGKPMKFNIYAPKGSQMLYASDQGAFGKGENEMILQRGGTYEITKIYWGTDATDGGRRKIFVDMEIHPEVGYDLFQQDPSEWTGSRKNYRD